MLVLKTLYVTLNDLVQPIMRQNNYVIIHIMLTFNS